MKWRHVPLCAVGILILLGGRLRAADSNATVAVAATAPVYVPDMSRRNVPLPDGILGWDSLIKETNVPANIKTTFFEFSFTNVSPDKVAILDVHAGCSCTTAKLPPLPWVIAPGTNGQLGFTVNLAGRMGALIKAATVTTDKGFKQLLFKINIQAPVLPTQTEAQRANAVLMATADRQAIFRGDCVTCHVKPGEGRYGKPLYDAACGICHDSKKRAEIVPDLHNIKTATNAEFWKTWISNGKPGSLMPAFSTANGGTLSDIQIASLVNYLLAAFPPQPAANQ